MAFGIGFAGVVALVIAGVVGVVVSAGGGRRAQLVMATTGLICITAFITWGISAPDGQPWSVSMGRGGGSDTDEVGDGPTGALLGRTVLRSVGTGLLLGSLFVFFVNRSKRHQGGARRRDDSDD